ncbi:hypothetical protein HMPREF0658_1756 [Hoylesella marshii DSM 16973 = JCM 13450]|uniref:Uncharacterized protein n=1 Tax=Hoylesella marshii DSM 16973 = JCM 13450 TaxID=862515 RepID=E0NUA3_9BACT|nr:hypothetical protein HMPREF0658_1756 [Hoylesella marshii DSM 16973 = JCM 13450]
MYRKSQVLYSAVDIKRRAMAYCLACGLPFLGSFLFDEKPIGSVLLWA